MASPGNQHFANCIGTLSFPIEQAICLTGNHRIIYQHISQLTSGGVCRITAIFSLLTECYSTKTTADGQISTKNSDDIICMRYNMSRTGCRVNASNFDSVK